jgi:hypothetical protein
VEERIETTAIHNAHSWEDVVVNLVTKGEVIVQVAADYLLQRLKIVGTLKFIKKNNAMIRMNHFPKNAEDGNVIVAHALSQSLSLSQSEHQEYLQRTPMIFKFQNPTKMGGKTFRYTGVDWIQGDVVMDDTGCDIMLITLSMALGMKLPMIASNTKVHTSVSKQSGV